MAGAANAGVDGLPVAHVGGCGDGTTGEVKLFVINAARESIGRVLAVAFRRATVEHAFRLAKTEAGLMHCTSRGGSTWGWCGT